jgi:hypothetical protein
MKRALFIAVALSLGTSLAFAQATSPLLATSAPTSLWHGRWSGAFDLGQQKIAFELEVGPLGALLDIPSNELFGYPSAAIQFEPNALAVDWQFGGGILALRLDLDPDGRATGIFAQGEAQGQASATRAAIQGRPGVALAVTGTGGDLLPGTLVLPQGGQAKPPLVILHAGLGSADRDGNNYNVPGRHDALMQLADALAELGVASYRYDKRGSGMASWLVRSEMELSFQAWIDDLVEIAGALAKDARFSGVWLLGLNDGATVAVAAANRLPAARGLVVACASADSVYESFLKAIQDAPEELKAEGLAALQAVRDGKPLGELSEFYSGALRASFRPYLREAFAYDLKAELGRYRGKTLIAQGNMDMQATLNDFTRLGEAASDAVTIVVPYMNHVLKDVPADVEENFAAFSDPSYPVSEIFASAVAEFVGAR